MKELTEIYGAQFTFVFKDVSDEGAAEVERLSTDETKLRELADSLKHITGADDVLITDYKLFIREVSPDEG